MNIWRGITLVGLIVSGSSPVAANTARTSWPVNGNVAAATPSFKKALRLVIGYSPPPVYPQSCASESRATMQFVPRQLSTKSYLHWQYTTILSESINRGRFSVLRSRQSYESLVHFQVLDQAFCSAARFNRSVIARSSRKLRP